MSTTRKPKLKYGTIEVLDTTSTDHPMFPQYYYESPFRSRSNEEIQEELGIFITPLPEISPDHSMDRLRQLLRRSGSIGARHPIHTERVLLNQEPISQRYMDNWIKVQVWTDYHDTYAAHWSKRKPYINHRGHHATDFLNGIPQTRIFPASKYGEILWGHTDMLDRGEFEIILRYRHLSDTTGWQYNFALKEDWRVALWMDVIQDLNLSPRDIVIAGPALILRTRDLALPFLFQKSNLIAIENTKDWRAWSGDQVPISSVHSEFFC